MTTFLIILYCIIGFMISEVARKNNMVIKVAKGLTEEGEPAEVEEVSISTSFRLVASTLWIFVVIIGVVMAYVNSFKSYDDDDDDDDTTLEPQPV